MFEHFFAVGVGQKNELDHVISYDIIIYNPDARNFQPFNDMSFCFMTENFNLNIPKMNSIHILCPIQFGTSFFFKCIKLIFEI